MRICRNQCPLQGDPVHDSLVSVTARKCTSFEMPTGGAESLVGRPLLRQASRSSRRCSGDQGRQGRVRFAGQSPAPHGLWQSRSLIRLVLNGGLVGSVRGERISRSSWERTRWWLGRGVRQVLGEIAGQPVGWIRVGSRDCIVSSFPGLQAPGQRRRIPVLLCGQHRVSFSGKSTRGGRSLSAPVCQTSCWRVAPPLMGGAYWTALPEQAQPESPAGTPGTVYPPPIIFLRLLVVLDKLQ